MKRGLPSRIFRRFKDAVTAFEAAVEQNPGLADAWLYKGICHVHLGCFS